ncbi:MAG TPA: LssY C-terminal domain-containing protein [Candidatus Saccharimonadales bacterium]|nr:LssY C-terminal domain-containing protein [Candidatus Saccharimonadales bacterium]
MLATIGFLAYETAFKVFPYIDNRTPLVLTLVLCYGLLAYVVIPLCIRLLRLILRPNHVPTHCSTPDGWPSDPINIAITVKNRRHFVRAMRRAGWLVADKNTLRNDLREGWALLTNSAYPTAPCSHLFLFNRPQDIAFQIAVGPSPRTRHHVRFWQVDTDHKDGSFWLHRFKKLVGLERQLWVGSATFDKHMFGMRWRTLQLTHYIDADTNKERDFLLLSLQTAGFVKDIHTVRAGEPYTFRGQSFGSSIFSDGLIKLCELRLLASTMQNRTNNRRHNNTDTQ